MEGPRPRRLLVISARMGAGHDAVAGELARRLRTQGHRVTERDLLGMLPPGLGTALRGAYRTVLRHWPGLYERVFTEFFRGDGRRRLGSAPLAASAAGGLLRTVEVTRPDAVVSTFHLAAQAAGRLRVRGELTVPSAVVITDFVAHRQWLHPGNDLHLCLTEAAAVRATERTERAAVAVGPVVPPEFHRASRGHDPGPAGDSDGRWSRELARYAPERPAVLVNLGAWGIGSDLAGTAALLNRSGYLPVLLCGCDERLRNRLARLPGTLALSWIDDLAELMASAVALVDNAAGQTALQAVAGGLPVIGYRPLPGHGADGVSAMAAAGLSTYARGPYEFQQALATLTRPGPTRERQDPRARAACRADVAQLVTELAGCPGRSHPVGW